MVVDRREFVSAHGASRGLAQKKTYQPDPKPGTKKPTTPRKGKKRSKGGCRAMHELMGYGPEEVPF